LQRWHQGVKHDPPLHTGAEMEDALKRHFKITHQMEGHAFAHQFIGSMFLDDTPQSVKVLLAFKKHEQLLLNEKNIISPGVRFVVTHK
jgi:hypothetical protein